MSRIKRGGYLIEFWMGDHNPKHVHVYKDSKLIAKVEVPNMDVLTGKLNRKLIKIVSFNNKKKVLDIVYVSGKRVFSHYSIFGIKKNISKVWVDRETKGMSIGLEFEDGKKDYIPYDQPLYFAKDPEYLLQLHIEKLILHIKKAMKAKNISKRFLSSQLETSDNQIHRLLNPSILNKNLEQLYKIAALIGLEIEINIRDAA